MRHHFTTFAHFVQKQHLADEKQTQKVEVDWKKEIHRNHHFVNVHNLLKILQNLLVLYAT